MKFSICIPNYNYAHYLPLTFASIRNSTYQNIEVVVSDNASTDNSLEVLLTEKKKFQYFTFQVNPVNLGFAPNLDKAASLATGDYIIMLSSDDIMEKDALATYYKLATVKPNAILSSAWDIIDSEGTVTGRTGPNSKIWTKEDIDADLSKEIGCAVYRMKSNLLLKRCFQQMSTPFNFCTVAYNKKLYVRVGGYEGTRLINPDKWFHWKLLTHAEEAIYVDKALFQYRWHNQNQTAQQLNTGYLKYMVDEYRNTIEITPAMLSHAAINREEFIEAFVKCDVYRHGLGEFSRGRWLKSCRVFFFGLSTYPGKMVWNRFFIFYIIVLFTTPIGSWLVSKLKQ
ncbi:MAG: glycosyltransferase family 2 protein [Cyclobacteriaceae bacterium]|nr:glycosyltransferase family 2 protein [Cyclobacteriaceae bacterium]